jgi:PTS system ascorbate-specific IIA component
MVGILIIAHGTFGEALIGAVSHVLGKRPPHVQQIGIRVRDDPEATLRQARELVRELNQGAGVLVLTDILGATPSNIAAKLAAPGAVEVVAGVNLPMLVRALTYRNEPLAAVVVKAISGGRDGVAHLGSAQSHAATGS